MNLFRFRLRASPAAPFVAAAFSVASWLPARNALPSKRPYHAPSGAKALASRCLSTRKRKPCSATSSHAQVHRHHKHSVQSDRDRLLLVTELKNSRPCALLDRSHWSGLPRRGRGIVEPNAVNHGPCNAGRRLCNPRRLPFALPWLASRTISPSRTVCPTTRRANQTFRQDARALTTSVLILGSAAQGGYPSGTLPMMEPGSRSTSICAASTARPARPQLQARPGRRC